MAGEWTFEQITAQAQIDEAFAVYASNPTFYRMSQGTEATRETVLEDMRAAPEGFDREKKRFLLARYAGRAAAVLDLLCGYPDARTLYIGLFVVRGDMQGQGAGRSLLSQIERLSAGRYDAIRLGVLEKNAAGLAFWRKMGFHALCLAPLHDKRAYVMEKRLDGGAPRNLRVKAVFFDLDGTLLNTLDDLAASVNAALTAYGMPQRTVEEVRGFVGNGMKKLIERAVPDGEENPQFQAVFDAFFAHNSLHATEHTRAYPGVLDLLDTLAAHGVKTAVVSNKMEPVVRELCEAFFGARLEAALGDVPERRRKPAPDSVIEAMRLLDVTARETAYVGDSEVDMMTAKNAGLRCIAVTWGFRPRDVLAGMEPDFLCDTADEVMAALETM